MTITSRRAAGAALTVALGASALLASPGAPADAAKRKSCTRGGATLEQAAGNVRIVRQTLRPGKNRTRRERISACWKPTGKRVTILLEEDLGDDLVTSSTVVIRGGRWVGVVARYTGGVSESIRAAVWDARRGRMLHDSDACDVERGDTSGIDEAAFGPDGDMAYACDRLLLYRRGAQQALTELEPLGTEAGTLAFSDDSARFSSRLHWVVRDGETITAKSTEV